MALAKAAAVLATVVVTTSMASAQASRDVTKTWAYTTWYAGNVFVVGESKNPTGPDGGGYKYDFLTVETEDFTQTSRGVKSVTTRRVLANGYAAGKNYHFENNKPVTDRYSCFLTTKPNELKSTTSFGTNVEPVPVTENPLIQVAWSIPIPNAQNTKGVVFKNKGQNCSPNPTGQFFNGREGAVFDASNTPDTVDEAFNGRAQIRYNDLVDLGNDWKKPFKVNLTGSKKSNVDGFVHTAEWAISTEVHFKRNYARDNQLKTVNKVGALLLREGLEALGIYNYNPPPDTVLVPGMGTGDVKLDVGATIVPPPRNRRRSSAAGGTQAKPVIIARGAAHVANDTPFYLKIVQTPAGKALIRGAHPKLKGTLTLSLKLAGSKKWLTKSKSLVWPLYPPAP
jgi:hypothetical protein